MNRLAQIPLLQAARVEPVATHLVPPAPTSGSAAPDFFTAASPTVEWREVVLLRRRASEELTEQWAQMRESGGAWGITEDDRKVLGRRVVDEIVHRHAEELALLGEAMWSPEHERRYANAVYDSIFGYGRLQPLFEIPDAENIEINGCDRVSVQYGDGRRVEHAPVADSDEELIEAIRFLGESATPTRPFDDAHPTMTLALGDRYRLHAIGFGLVHRPSITIRQHTMTSVSLADLAQTGMLPREVARFLHAAVLARKSLVISGDQGAGKTTLLRALVSAIPLNERIGTLETDYELLTHLQPERRHVVALQARVGMGERVDGRLLGEVTVADLFPEALRQNLSRLIVGEVRGSEAAAMFEAAQVGPGLMATTHSHSATATIDRLASRVAQGGVLSVDEAYWQIAHNLSLLIHVKLVDDTWRGGTRRRYVSEIRRLTGGIEAGRPTTHLVYQAGPEGTAGVLSPDADFAAELEPFHRVWDSHA